jgi:hypothetical protein
MPGVYRRRQMFATTYSRRWYKWQRWPGLRAFASVFAPFVYKAMIQAASVRAALAATEGQPEA